MLEMKTNVLRGGLFSCEYLCYGPQIWDVYSLFPTYVVVVVDVSTTSVTCEEPDIADDDC